jgi:uroporphyrinogen decarboxylase
MFKPDFERNTLRILQGQLPERPALFELFLNDAYYARLTGHPPKSDDPRDYAEFVAEAMGSVGYDYASVVASSFGFKTVSRDHKDTTSLNAGFVITDRESFERYQWLDPDAFDTSAVETAHTWLPEGMKLMVRGPGGVLENIISLMGYDNLCLLLHDDPELVKAVADKVGSSLVKYYKGIVDCEGVGFLCSNDDWGFNTQTMLSPADMRRYIFPWHKRIVDVAHKAGKPCILHSCGYFGDVIEDVIEDMRYDGRHSYEDIICPVEEAYERLAGRIAVLGGIDMDFMVRHSPEEIHARSTAMLERSHGRGYYFLGTGNSVPEYVPFDNYMAMVNAAHDWRDD